MDVDRRVLAGRVVLEMGGYLAAPFATSILRGLGARVIKVESPGGDPFRAQRGLWVSTNAGKESVVCDLATPDGRAMLDGLVARADIVVENLNPDAAVKLGVTYADLVRHNPEIVVCSIKGFGSGPYQTRRATNPIIEAITGLMSVTNQGGRPARQAVPLFDQMAGALAAVAVLGSLSAPVEEASRSVEVNLFETALYMVGSRLAGAQLSPTATTRNAMFELAPYGTFCAGDGQWLFLGAINDRCWRELAVALGIDGYDDPALTTSSQRAARMDEVEEMTQRAVGRLSSGEVLERMHALGVPCAPVNDFAEVLADQHTASPGKLDHVDVDGRLVGIPAFPIVSGHPVPESLAPPPRLGEHTDAVLAWFDTSLPNGASDV